MYLYSEQYSYYCVALRRDFKGYQLEDPGQHYRLCSRPANAEAHMSNLLLSMAQKMGVKADQFADSRTALKLG